MYVAGIMLMIVGLGVWAAGQVWFSIVASRKSLGWALGVTLPFVGWYFLAVQPARSRWPFGVRSLGLSLAALGMLTFTFSIAPVIGDDLAVEQARADARNEAAGGSGRPPGVPENLEAVAAPRPIANGAGFDLIALDEGAALVYGPTVDEGGGIKLVRLDRTGVVQGAPIDVFTPEREARLDGRLGVLELRATLSADRIAVVWLEPGASGWVARAALGPLEGPFGAPLRLGAVAQPRPTTGRLAVAGDGVRGFRVAWHQGTRGCSRDMAESTGSEDCMTVGVSDLPPTREARRVVEVPGSCDPAIAGGGYAGGRYAFAACGLWNEQPNLSLIRPGDDGAYHETQVGCPPNGIAAVDDHLVGTARCGDRTHWIRFTASGEAEEASEVTEACSDEGMPLPSGAGRALRADETVGSLAALLSDRIAPAHARAVWTGTMVLVASTTRGEVSLKRWGCWDGHFMRIDAL